MREIKFRAWDKRKKCILRVRAMTFNNNETIHPAEVYAVMTLDQDGHLEDNNYPDDIILMQYTGLKDKGDKEIYEGDFLEDKHGNRGLIEWCPPKFEWFEKITKKLCGIEWSKCKVVGNIYENPELLKES